MYTDKDFTPINIHVLAGVSGFSGHPNARELDGLRNLIKNNNKEYSRVYKTSKTAVDILNKTQHLVSGAFKVKQEQFYGADIKYLIIYKEGLTYQDIKPYLGK